MSPVTNRRGGPCNSSTRFPRSPLFGLLRAFPALWPDRGVSRYPPMVALALFSAGKILMTIGRSFGSAYSWILLTITPWNFCCSVAVCCAACSNSSFLICSSCTMFRGYSITPRNFCVFVHLSFVFVKVRRSGERSGRRSSTPTALDDIPPSAGAVSRWEHNPVPIANKTVILFFSAVGCP